ncbi:unnamed protein product [Dibothriocephalus latus]|uniref:Uncharacterized protein n=1 Tax=Dibothriocephalus latus TaxID=60516 RepID=A0A3P7NLM3_DIBLA|nr:unnamed protein product [Dibothriocephalus latus]
MTSKRFNVIGHRSQDFDNVLGSLQYSSSGENDLRGLDEALQEFAQKKALAVKKRRGPVMGIPDDQLPEEVNDMKEDDSLSEDYEGDEEEEEEEDEKEVDSSLSFYNCLDFVTRPTTSRRQALDTAAEESKTPVVPEGSNLTLIFPTVNQPTLLVISLYVIVVISKMVDYKYPSVLLSTEGQLIINL